MIRLFVGLGLPDVVADTLADLALGIPGARWIESRNLHVTLRFVGEVEEPLAQDLHDHLSEVRAPAFMVTVNGLGTFGSRQPHALWAGVEKTPELVHLQGKVDSAVTRAGLPAEPRKFSPHVTLARLKGAPTGRIQEFIAGHSPLKLGPFHIDRFIMFRSHLGRAGAEYEEVAEYPLG
ncbi:MAG: RNA 2',3'-cyclic phosphodiesterase [Solirubrobacterales bacterium]